MDDLYLKVYALEAVFALLLFFIILACRKDRTVVFTLLFTASQVIFESLKHDGHMAFGFVGVQHLLCYTLLGVTVIVLGRMAWKKGCKVLPIIGWVSVLPVAGIAVGLEFAYDRTNTAPVLLYAAYLVLVAYMAGLGFGLLRAGRKKEN